MSKVVCRLSGFALRRNHDGAYLTPGGFSNYLPTLYTSVGKIQALYSVRSWDIFPDQFLTEIRALTAPEQKIKKREFAAREFSIVKLEIQAIEV
jgi:hypothetical protein